MLYYVRHGQTVWNRQQRLQGRGDSPLTLWGVELAVAYGRHLRDALRGRDVRVYSSPMGRARQTAVVVADLIGCGGDAVVLDELLAEHDVGGWGGKTWVEIERDESHTREVLRHWGHRPPNGETRREMFTRAHRFLANLAPEPSDESVVVVVSHGGFSRAFRGAWLGLGEEHAAELSTHDHGRLYRLTEGEAKEIVTDDTPPPPEAALG